MVLVHGFGHGAWCWYKLVSLLRTKGPHRVTALDLAGCGVHPKQLHQISSISDYVQPLMDFLAALPDDEKAVLVGHSYGGIPIALAMERFPAKVSCAVFVAAYMPNSTDPPGTFMQEFFKRGAEKSFMDFEVKFDQESGKVPISASIGPEFMAAKLYERCPLEDMELGKMLVRPGSLFMEDLATMDKFSDEKFGSVPRVYVIAAEDKTIPPDFQRWLIENNPVKEVKEIKGADHMPMFTQPDALCKCLLEIAEKHA
ncbi:methylesterase 10 [Phtheirospermum japonicum]|uniref:Methylesterase 10 n=1 Tax=Phtheirospermum japonicum TaxID=374723 RepID=A0A830B7D5_9LAMI|nr:methylesterase 10 [Phtheirospermum japonicum]